MIDRRERRKHTISNHNYASSSCKKSLLYLCLSALVLVTAESLKFNPDLRVPIMSRKILKTIRSRGSLKDKYSLLAGN